ncbi:MAG TPA: DUF1842 domain-containing protein [Bacilli bacterium]|nr:DUF1842 domain-containing protein [Bacilli bacterium]
MQTNTAVGLFIASYQITTGLAGAPVLHANFAVNTVDKTVSVFAHLTNTSNPPLNIENTMQGTYTEEGGTIKVTANAPLLQEFPPVSQVTKLEMTLTNWESGTATYSYTEAGGNPHVVENAPVHKLNADGNADQTVLAATSNGIKTFRLGSGLLGAPVMTAHLEFGEGSNNMVLGEGNVFYDQPEQTVTYFKGTYTYLTVMPPHNSRILVVAMGFPVPPNGDVMEIEANAYLHMVLDHEMKSGLGNFKYKPQGSDEFKVVENVPVKLEEK